MEEKPNNSSSEGSSGAEQKPADNPGSGGASGGMNATTEKLIEDVKKFNVLSLVGLGLIILFFIFMFIAAVNYKWWLMLTIAGASGFLLYRQHSDTRGFEKKACFYGMIVLGVLFLFRDIGMSNTLDTWNKVRSAASSIAIPGKK